MRRVSCTRREAKSFLKMANTNKKIAIRAKLLQISAVREAGIVLKRI